MKKQLIVSLFICCTLLFGCADENTTNKLEKKPQGHEESNSYTYEENNNDQVVNIEKEQLDTNPNYKKLNVSRLEEYFKADFDSNGDWPTYSSEAKLFGYPENFWDGCSKWCVIEDFYVNAVASSTLKSEGKYSYDATNVSNPNRDNSWVEGAEDEGIGEYIEIYQMSKSLNEDPEDVSFNEICIVNGYTATIKNWIENNRVRELKLYFNDEYVANIELEDTMKPQYIDISSLNLTVADGKEAKFKFEIADVYRGEKYNDTAITGIDIDFSGSYYH